MVYNKIFLSVFIFSAISLDGMNMKKMRKQADTCEQSMQNCFLTPSGIGRIPHDVTLGCIQRKLTLQDIAHLKQTSKTCNQLYDVENVCPFVLAHTCELRCPNYSCRLLAENYYACTKALEHFASKENKETKEQDRETFKHLWVCHAKVRNDNVARLLCKPALSVGDQMSVYKSKKHYGKAKRSTQYSILDHLAQVLADRNGEAAKTILCGGVLNIKNLVKNCQGQGSLGQDWLILSAFVEAACLLGDSELVYLLFGKDIGKYELKGIMTYGAPYLVIELIDRDMLLCEHDNHHGKTLLHYAARHNQSSVVTMLLKKGFCVNSKTNKGDTPLHYAVRYDRVSCVMALLARDDCDSRLKNHRGLTPLDLIEKRLYVGQVMKKRHGIIIRNFLLSHLSNYEQKDAVFFRGADSYEPFD